MIDLHFALYGDPRTKKNSRTASRDGRVILPSKAYQRYRRECLMQITGPYRLHIDRPVNVRCVYYMQTRRIVDLVGLLQGTDDILTDAGVIVDDNSRIIAGHDGSRVRDDKHNPRVEITITEMEGRER